MFYLDKVKLGTVIALIRFMLWWGMQTIQKFVCQDPKTAMIQVDYNLSVFPQSRWGMTKQKVPWMMQIQNKEMQIYQFYKVTQN